MRTLPPTLQAALDGGVTTLATCWRLARRDGTVLGFTDHDRDLVLDGVTYAAATGLSGSEATSAMGFAPAAGEIEGALVSDVIDAADLATGRFDGATVEVLLVDWSAPATYVRLRRATLGEVESRDGAFRAELRGAAAALDVPRGRLYRHGCDATLGDARCGIDLASVAFTGSGTVSVLVGDRTPRVSGLGAYPAGWFEHGRLLVESGTAGGLAAQVKRHTIDDGAALIELWRAVPGLGPGDEVTLTAGCDKLFATCRAKFDNGVNFRGFPHIPGDDFALAHPARRTGRGRPGGAVVRG